MIGLKRGTVKLCRQHKEWVKLYRKERDLLLSALSNQKVRVEHVGSTAIPGVWAKPIIDIVLSAPANQLKMVYRILKQIGYIDRGEQGRQGRRLFVRGPEEKRTHYLHVTRNNSKVWEEHILFRDYLR